MRLLPTLAALLPVLASAQLEPDKGGPAGGGIPVGRPVAIPLTGRFLAVGVGRYADAKLRPDPAYAGDARRMADCLKGRGLRGETLLDAGATRAAVLKALADAARDLGPDDAFVLYLSGHHDASPGGGFLPADYAVARRAGALTSSDLALVLERLPCARVTAILDVSYAEALAVPSKKVGYVLASRRNEPALSLDMGNGPQGLFTRSLLATLAGGAPSWPAAVAETGKGVTRIIAAQKSARKQTPVLVGEPDARLLGGLAAGRAIQLKVGDRVQISGSDVVYVVGKDGKLSPLPKGG